MHAHPYAGVARALASTPFGAIDYRERTGSTNADAADLLGDERFAGRTFVADYQTLGRGRKGRSWSARAGTALLFTTILPRPVAAASLWIVPFWSALAVKEALDERGVETALHWPNDLLLGPRKIAGILCVSRIAGSSAWAGVGVGINVHRQGAAAAEIEPPPAFCDDARPVERPDLLAGVLRAYDRTVNELDDPEGVARRWERAAGLPGRRYRILKDASEAPFEATALRLHDGGGLAVRHDDGRDEVVGLADARALR